MNRLSHKIIFVIIAALFLLGIKDLFYLRFKAGDVYPVYSSLRPDPLGTKVLYRSLENFPLLSVKRHYRNYEEWHGQPGSTLLFIGADVSDLRLREKEFFEALEKYARQGGTVIIAILPTEDTEEPKTCKMCKLPPKKKDEKAKKDSKDGKEPEEKDKTIEEEEEMEGWVYLDKRWGVTMQYQKINNNEGNPGEESEDEEDWEEYSAELTREAKAPAGFSGGPLPKIITWYSTLAFTLTDDTWQTLYTVNDKAVVIAKDFDKGSILLMSDAYLFSNESLWDNRQIQWLIKLFQSSKEIVFDEYHLGNVKYEGISDLMLKYRLTFFILSLVFIVALFIWKSSFSLIPRKQTRVQGAAVELVESRKDYFQGLVSLLRKHIPAKDVLNVCVEEWYKETGRPSMKMAPNVKKDVKVKLQIDNILSMLKARAIDPVRGFALIYERLTERDKYERKTR